MSEREFQRLAQETPQLHEKFSRLILDDMIDAFRESMSEWRRSGLMTSSKLEIMKKHSDFQLDGPVHVQGQATSSFVHGFYKGALMFVKVSSTAQPVWR